MTMGWATVIIMPKVCSAFLGLRLKNVSIPIFPNPVTCGGVRAESAHDLRRGSGAGRAQRPRQGGDPWAHLGSAHTDAELGILLERAPRDGGRWPNRALDFEVAAPAVAAVVPPGRTMGAHSRLLYDVLRGRLWLARVVRGR